MTKVGITDYNSLEVRIMCEKIDPAFMVCGNCTYFVQHYVDLDGRFVAILAGNCTYPRLKNRDYKNTCPNWTPKLEKNNQP